MNKTLDFHLAIKATDAAEEGSFEGLASPFGGKADSYGDVVDPGAYIDSLIKHKRNGTMPVMLWSHNPDEPIGVWKDFSETPNGLYGKGQLLKGIRRADEVHLMLKAGAVRGLSIGYREIEGEQDGDVYRLKKLDLHEVSIVAFPAAPRARVTTVKSDHLDVLRKRLLAGEPPTDREWEKGMRDAFGLSNSEAERAVRLCLKGRAQGEPGEHETDLRTQATVALLRDALKGFTPSNMRI